MRKKHLSAKASRRYCWICGDEGGSRCSRALLRLGYAVRPHQIAYAHSQCLNDAILKRAADDFAPLLQRLAQR